MEALLAALIENRMTLVMLLGVVLVGLTLVQRRKQNGSRTPAPEDRPATTARSAQAQAAAPSNADDNTPSPAVSRTEAVHTAQEPALDDLSEDFHAGDSIAVSEADPLEEAHIFLQYGYFDRAAELLRWFADNSEGTDPDILRLLMDVYLRLKQIDDYAEILERLIAASGAGAGLQQALLEGLKLDPENLPLRVLAKGHFGLGIEQVNALIGFEAPQAMPEDAEEPVAKTASSRASKPTTAKSHPAPATSPASSRARRPLLTGETPLAPLSTDEKNVVRAFCQPGHEAKLHLLTRNYADAVPALQRAIAEQPKALIHYTELLKIHQARRDAGAYARTLWQLYAVLGSAGHALRERLLASGFTLGHHTALEALAQAKDASRIETIGLRFGYLTKEAGQRRRLHLIEASHAAGGIRSSDQGDDILAEVDSYIEFGQIEHALDRLEEAILAEPTAVYLYPPLLELYDRMDDLDRFSAFDAQIKQNTLRPPEEVVAMMSSLYQRLKDRTEKIAA